ncbi:hypothetical protein D623_10021863 [Myotis brandtii]|uniref:Uncharacterized protein n=1 Tax=Myotis brandtii TaxID=109478 RepID=S7N913_MYOBR|nr:hypothetical protein D623_10021863 [Myotis brandtii]
MGCRAPTCVCSHRGSSKHSAHTAPSVSALRAVVSAICSLLGFMCLGLPALTLCPLTEGLLLSPQNPQQVAGSTCTDGLQLLGPGLLTRHRAAREWISEQPALDSTAQAHAGTPWCSALGHRGGCEGPPHSLHLGWSKKAPSGLGGMRPEFDMLGYSIDLLPWPCTQVREGGFAWRVLFPEAPEAEAPQPHPRSAAHTRFPAVWGVVHSPSALKLELLLRLQQTEPPRAVTSLSCGTCRRGRPVGGRGEVPSFEHPPLAES